MGAIQSRKKMKHSRKLLLCVLVLGFFLSLSSVSVYSQIVSEKVSEPVKTSLIFEIEDFNQAIKLKPDNAVAYYNRGTARKVLGQHEAAEIDFEKAKEIDLKIGK